MESNYPEYIEGEPVIYQNGDKFELGIVKSICGHDEYFINYHTGDTAARTHARHLHKISNNYAFGIVRFNPDDEKIDRVVIPKKEYDKMVSDVETKVRLDNHLRKILKPLFHCPDIKTLPDDFLDLEPTESKVAVNDAWNDPLKNYITLYLRYEVDKL